MESPIHTKLLSCGIDRLLLEKTLNTSLSYGLVTNESSVSRSGIPIKQALIEAGYRIIRLFSPEHGLQARGVDGAPLPDSLDPLTGIPVTSLYGNQLKPSREFDTFPDVIFLDLPNAGVRFYTYLWTMSFIMEWCAEEGLPLIILDRPNPLGADLSCAEGPMMMPGYHSFIGRWNIPIRFSLTLGELALLLKREMDLDKLSLQIVKTEGCERKDTILDWQYPFKPPSPAILSPTTYLTYPSLCFLEATNISEGRGGPDSFEVAYAPWIKSKELEETFNQYAPQGVEALPYQCIPQEGKYKNQFCEGIRLQVTDYTVYGPVKVGMLLLALLKTKYPDHFEWKPYPTLVNPSGDRHFELLTGGVRLKSWLEKDPLNSLDELEELLAVPGWADRVKDILLYL